MKQKANAFGMVLYHCAKENRDRKFHALYDKVYRPDILKAAWNKVKSNRGSSGIDGQTIEYIKYELTERKFLNQLYLKLKHGEYKPSAVRRVYIPKDNGDKRPLGIPTIEDRVVQQAMRSVIEPIFEADFKDCSYGFRPNRNAHDAIKMIKKASRKNYWVVDVDIKGYFDNINHDKLIKLVEKRISDKRIIKMIRGWLKAGVLENGELESTPLGSPQGGVISPLLANIYLNYLDTIWQNQFSHLGTLIRYADDIVILTSQKRTAIESIRVLKTVFSRLELEMNLEKSKLVNIWDNKEGFDFLGLHHRKFKVLKPGGKEMHFLQSIPSKKAMRKMKATFKAYISPRNRLFWQLEDFIPGLNRKVVGMRNYYKLSSIGDRWLAKIDRYIIELLTLHHNKRRNHHRKRAELKEIVERTKRFGLEKFV